MVTAPNEDNLSSTAFTVPCVVIADDQAFIRHRLRAVLSEDKDIHVCAEAVDGRDALVKADIVIKWT